MGYLLFPYFCQARKGGKYPPCSQRPAHLSSLFPQRECIVKLSPEDETSFMRPLVGRARSWNHSTIWRQDNGLEPSPVTNLALLSSQVALPDRPRKGHFPVPHKNEKLLLSSEPRFQQTLLPRLGSPDLSGQAGLVLAPGRMLSSPPQAAVHHRSWISSPKDGLTF